MKYIKYIAFIMIVFMLYSVNKINANDYNYEVINKDHKLNIIKDVSLVLWEDLNENKIMEDNEIIDKWKSNRKAYRLNNIKENHHYIISQLNKHSVYENIDNYYFNVKEKNKTIVLTHTLRSFHFYFTNNNKILNNAYIQILDENKNKVIETNQPKIEGLDINKTYYLREIKAPLGYKKIKDDIKLNLNEKELYIENKENNIQINFNNINEIHYQLLDKDKNIIKEISNNHISLLLNEDETYYINQLNNNKGYVKLNHYSFKANKDINIECEKTKVYLSSKDEQLNNIEDVIIEIYDKEKLIHSYISKNIAEEIIGLEENKEYEIKVIYINNQYLKKDKPILFKVIHNKEINIIFKKLKVNILNKHNQLVKDGEYIIWEDLNENNIMDDNEIRDRWIHKDIHIIRDLTENHQYILTEYKIPESYSHTNHYSFNANESFNIYKEYTKLKIKHNQKVNSTYYLYDENHNHLKTITVNDNTLIEGLILNKQYYLKEIETEKGYVLQDNYYFNMKDNDMITLNHNRYTFDVKNKENEKLKDIKFKVWEDRNHNNICEQNEVIETFKYKDTYYLSSLRVNHTYNISQENTLNGYVKEDDISFKVISKDYHIVIYNRLTKITLNQNSHASYELYDSLNHKIQSFTLNKSYTLYGLNVNEKYYLKQVKKEEGYVKKKDIEFIMKDSKIINIKSQRVSLIVKDKDNKLLNNGLFILWNDTNLNGKCDNDEIIENINIFKSHYINNVEEGKSYILSQSKGNYGYYKSHDIYFNVPNNDYEIVVINKEMKGSISLYSENYKDIKFKYGLYNDKKCINLINTFNLYDQYKLKDLKIGMYYIKQIQSPQGYSEDDRVISIHVNPKKLNHSLSIIHYKLPDIKLDSSKKISVFKNKKNNIKESNFNYFYIIIGIIFTILISIFLKKKSSH